MVLVPAGCHLGMLVPVRPGVVTSSSWWGPGADPRRGVALVLIPRHRQCPPSSTRPIQPASSACSGGDDIVVVGVVGDAWWLASSWNFKLWFEFQIPTSAELPLT